MGTVTRRMLWTLVFWSFVDLGDVLYIINTTSLWSLDVSKGGTTFIVTTFWNNRNKQTKNRHSLMIKCTGPLKDLLISCREQSHHRHCWRNWGVFQPFLESNRKHLLKFKILICFDPTDWHLGLYAIEIKPPVLKDMCKTDRQKTGHKTKAHQ